MLNRLWEEPDIKKKDLRYEVWQNLKEQALWVGWGWMALVDKVLVLLLAVFAVLGNPAELCCTHYNIQLIISFYNY